MGELAAEVQRMKTEHAEELKQVLWFLCCVHVLI